MRTKNISKGSQFGQLTVIEECERPERSKHKAKHYQCQCSCGQKIIARSDNLLNKKNPTRSCGCSSSRYRIKPGSQWGEYTTLRKLPSFRQTGGTKFVYWECKCSCGRIDIVRSDHLLRNKPWNLHCKDISHPSDRLHYPPSEYEMPPRVKYIFERYYPKIQKYSHQNHLYDIAFEKLERASYIIWHRELGVNPVLNEEAYINKVISLTELESKKRKAVEKQSADIYTSQEHRSRGRVMTNSMMTIQAIIEALPDITPSSERPKKPKRFRRC